MLDIGCVIGNSMYYNCMVCFLVAQLLTWRWDPCIGKIKFTRLLQDITQDYVTKFLWSAHSISKSFSEILANMLKHLSMFLSFFYEKQHLHVKVLIKNFSVVLILLAWKWSTSFWPHNNQSNQMWQATYSKTLFNQTQLNQNPG